MTQIYGPAESAVIRRVRSAASAYRTAHPLTPAAWEASSYPLAANVYGRPDVKTLVWFPGPGCTWSAAGGCLMCDFGHSDELPGAEPAVVLEQHLRELDPATAHIHLGPGGSFYDDRETPAEVRTSVLKTLGSMANLRTVGLETRPNLVRADLLRATIRDLPRTVSRLILGFGVECYDDLLREIAVNKGYNRSAVLRAAAAIAEVNAEQDRIPIEFEHYVLLKPPLLGEGEAIEEALRTIDWSFRVGASTVALFMNTVKPQTVQGHLAAHPTAEPPLRYQTPYLRSAVEVLRRLPATQRACTAVLGLQSGIMATDGPRGCDRCYPFLLGAIYTHDFVRDPTVIERAATTWCPCRGEWEAELNAPTPAPLTQRALDLIDLMCADGYA
jgi:hypothetical protein